MRLAPWPSLGDGPNASTRSGPPAEIAAFDRGQTQNLRYTGVELCDLGDSMPALFFLLPTAFRPALRTCCHAPLGAANRAEPPVEAKSSILLQDDSWGSRWNPDENAFDYDSVARSHRPIPAAEPPTTAIRTTIRRVQLVFFESAAALSKTRGPKGLEDRY